MTEEPQDEPAQQTDKGLTIPVPERDDVEEALQRMAQPAVEKPSRRRLRRPKE